MKFLAIVVALAYVCVSWAGQPRRVEAPPYERIPREAIAGIATPADAPCCSKTQRHVRIGPHAYEEDGAGRGVLGCPGKNIAVCGENVAVCWGGPSPDQDNYFYLMYGYSTDGGATFPDTGHIMFNETRRIYPGVAWDCKAADSKPYFVWQEVDGSDPNYPDCPSTIYVTWDDDFPNAFMPPPVELPNSGDWHCWLPCITVRDSIVVVMAFNYQSNNCFVWRSVDGGLNWDNGQMIIDTESEADWETINNPVVRWGDSGYVFAIFDWGDDAAVYTPHFMESTDYGVTWSAPTNLWTVTGGPPYPDCSGSWWYVYDCVVDTLNVPHCVWKFGSGTYEYGDIHCYRPTAGSPGAWTTWEHQCVVGDCDGNTVVTQPTIGVDLNTNYLHITYSGFWDTDSGDGTPDIGHLFSVDGGANWADRGPGLGTTPWYDLTAETAIEASTFWATNADTTWGWGNVIYIDERDDPQWICAFTCSIPLANNPPFIKDAFKKGDTYCGDIEFSIWADISDFGWPMTMSGVDSAWLYFWVNGDTANMQVRPMSLVEDDSLDGRWEAPIYGPFSLGDTVKYYFRAVDIQGMYDATTRPTLDDPYTFLIKEKDPNHNILFVIEDGDSIDGFGGEVFYNMDWEVANMVAQAGYDCDLWNGAKSQGPDSCVIAAGYDMIIWFSWGGDDFAADSLYIAQYLDGGGMLWVAIPDLLCVGLGMGRCTETLYPADSSFAAEYLLILDAFDDYFGCDEAGCFTNNRDTVSTFFGMAGDQISGAFAPGVDSFTVCPYFNENNPDSAYNFCGWVEPLPGAVSNFFFSDAALAYPSAHRTEDWFTPYKLFFQLWSPAWAVDSVEMQDTLITGFVRDETRLRTFVDSVMEWFGPTRVEETPRKAGFPLALYQNRPNPMTNSTRISFAVPTKTEVSMNVYDAAGRHVRTLMDGSTLGPGQFSVAWNGLDARGKRGGLLASSFFLA